MAEKNIDKSKIKNIVIRGPDWVGDFVVATPVYRELRKNFPGAKITAVVRGWTRGFLDNCPYINDIIEYDSRDNSPKNFFGLVKKLRKEKYDLAILLSGNYNAALVAWLSGIKYRAGYNYDKRGYLLTHSLKETGRELRLNRAVRILEHLGLNVESKKPELWLSQKDENFARDTMEPLIKSFPVLGRKPAVIGIGPGTQEIPKCWPVKKFIELIDIITEYKGYKVVLFGSVNDIKRGEKIMAEVRNKDKVINLINRTNLNEFAACAKYLNVYVTGDTGGMHIAYTMDTPVVALFGPTDPVEALLQKDNIRYIWTGMECSPCSLKESRHCRTLECIAGISVDRVKSDILLLV